MPSQQMVKATIENKKTFLKWAMNIEVGGGTNPIDAIEHSISLEPDAIWLLSDGAFGDPIVNRIQEVNQFIRIPIHTLAFAAQASVEQLEKVATQNFGKFIFVR